MSHGLRSTYVKGCRCDDCRRANREYQAQLARRQAQARFNPEAAYLVDASEVRRHLAHLRAAGIGRRQIAAISGVSETVILRLIGLDKKRPSKRIRPETAKRILAINLDQCALGGMVSALGTQRRLQALVAIGWSTYDLAQILGTTNTNISLIINRSTRVRARTAKEVEQIYRKLELTPGPSNRARLRAQRNGWVPPLAWDDIDHDPAPVQIEPDPELVDYQKFEMLLAGNKVATTIHERRVFITKLRDQGLTWYQIEQSLQLTTNTAKITYERYQKVMKRQAENAPEKRPRTTKLKPSAQPS